jgi:hypothetical protein
VICEENLTCQGCEAQIFDLLVLDRLDFFPQILDFVLEFVVEIFREMGGFVFSVS